MKTLTPVLYVESIEEALPFWTDRLGFDRQFDVPEDPTKPPEGQPIGFISVKNGNVEVMLQTRGSVANDMPSLAEGKFECTGLGLFVEVESLDPILKGLDGWPVEIPERKTFYGMREVGVRAPGGCLIVFAQRVGEGS